jgi:L-idonate 5-dehydrogenase
MSLACTLHGPLKLSVEIRPDDPEPQAGQVLVRLGAGGICGSDLHYYQHGRVGPFEVRGPFVPGHEASGVVEAVGRDVTRVRPRQKVAVNPAHTCGRCAACRAGRGNLCERMVFLGSAAIFPHIAGLFRERFVVDERQLTAVDEDVSLGEIACAEPLSIGLHAMHRAGEVLGRTVLVTGGGTIGCMTVIAARMAGAARVVVVDPSERARRLAAEVGADVVCGGDADVAEWANRVDVAVEAAGHPEAVLACLHSVRRGGRVVQVGTLAAPMMFPVNDVMVREIDYVGVFRADVEFDWAVQAIRTRRADVRPLISAQLPISQAEAAFKLALDRSRSTKVQLVPG